MYFCDNPGDWMFSVLNFLHPYNHWCQKLFWESGTQADWLRYCQCWDKKRQYLYHRQKPEFRYSEMKRCLYLFYHQTGVKAILFAENAISWRKVNRNVTCLWFRTIICSVGDIVLVTSRKCYGMLWKNEAGLDIQPERWCHQWTGWCW